MFVGRNGLSDPRSNGYPGEGLGGPEFYVESDCEGGPGIQPDSDFHLGLPVASFLVPGESKGILFPFSPSSFSVMGKRERLSLISCPSISFKVVCYSIDDELSGASAGAASPGGPVSMAAALCSFSPSSGAGGRQRRILRLPVLQGGIWKPKLVLYSSDSEDCGSSVEGNLKLVESELVGLGSGDREPGGLGFRIWRAETTLLASRGSPSSKTLAIGLVAETLGGFSGGLEEDSWAGWSSDAEEPDGRGTVRAISVPSTTMGSSPATSGFFTSLEKGSQRLFVESLDVPKGMSQNQWISHKMVHCGQIVGISVENRERGWDSLVAFAQYQGQSGK